MKINKSETYINNTSLVLEYIYRNPLTSRIEISRSTGLTPPSITHIVSNLLEKDWLVETGQETKEVEGSGRKRKILTLNKNIGYFIGIEINLKGIFISLTDILGTKIRSKSITSDKYNLKYINETIVNLLCKITNSIDKSKVFGAGIAIPGHYNVFQKKIISNNPQWSFFNLNEINKHFPFKFVVENNIECMALGEYLFNPKYTPDKFLFYHVGYGIFCSFFNAEHLSFKKNHYIGEVGHSVVDIDGPLCECGKRGCLQTYISDSWLIKKAQYLFDHSNNTSLKSLVNKSEEIDLQTILDAYELGDTYLNKQIDSGLILLGTSIANTLILRDADKIYLNSDLLRNKEFKERIIKIVIEQLSFIPTNRNIQIAVTDPDEYRGAKGAAALASFAFFIKNSNFTRIKVDENSIDNTNIQS